MVHVPERFGQEFEAAREIAPRDDRMAELAKKLK
jgi:hypothetical protein